MHFANKETIHGKAVRACSFVLAMLIMCSMMFVGNVVKIEADAVQFSGCIYFDFKSSNSRAWLTGARFGVKWKDASGNETFVFPDIYQSTNGIRLKDDDKLIYSLYIPSGKTCSQVQLLRVDPSDNTTIWTSSAWYDDVPTNGNNCLWINGGGFPDYSITDHGWYKLNVNSSTTPSSGMTAQLDRSLVNSSSSTGYSYGSNELFPVNAVFYDYLTDYELANGWRSNTETNTISRSYKNRIPFKGFNNYISGLSSDNSWNYPLYFGNFTSQWSASDKPDADYESYSQTFDHFYYGTLKDYNMYGNDGSVFDLGGASSFFRFESKGISSYTYGDGLANFSVYANDSEALNEKTGTYSGSVQGLVESTLENNKTLKMKGGFTSPYFSDTNEYVKTVSTNFPMRIKSTNNGGTRDGVSTTYTTYEFDSNGKNENEDGITDIVYFSYDNNGSANKLSYTQDTSYQVIDAYQSLGGNDSGDHRGFFPFDQGDGSYNKIATDYGFGMRLDIPFNLTEDGCIMSKDSNGGLHKTDIPMQFTFAGDDDVWVFIDGKLALDLGGDHGNAKGYINFALNKGDNPHKGVVTTGTVTLKETPVYGQTEYSGPGNSIDLIESGCLTLTDDNKYDQTEPHTLTVFYMERGLVESNLKLSFSISPVGNKLTVDNKIDYSNVNDVVKSRVQNYIERTGDYENQAPDEKFTFEVEQSSVELDNTKSYDKQDYKGDTTTNNSYDPDNNIEIDHNEKDSFNDQITDGVQVKVDENVSANNKYKYDTYYTVVDKVMEKNGEDNSTLVDNQKVNTATNGGGSVQFDFDTQTQQSSVKYNNFAVSVVNTIKLGKVNLKKVVQDSTGTAVTDDTTTFNFDVYIKLPHETAYQSTADTSLTCAANSESAYITNLPVGSTVKFVEKNLDTAAYTDKTSGYIEVVVDETESGATGTYTNEKIEPTVDAKVEATKNLDSSPSSVQFDFTLTKLNDGVKSTAESDIKTAQNGTDGKISFNLSDLEANQTFNYLLEEQSESNSIYNFDTNKYWVEVKTSTNPATVKYYKTTVNRDTYSKGDEVSGGVTFSNTTKTASIIVKKTDSNNETKDFTGTKFKIYEVTEEGAELPANAKEEKEITTSENTVTFDGLEHGKWYAIVETKAVDGYELNGTVFYRQADATKDVSVTADAEEITVTVQDNKSTNLPQTGGPGAVMLVLGGIVLVSVGVYLLKPSKKDKTNSK